MWIVNGVIEETEEGEGKFTATTHHPVVKVQNEEMVEKLPRFMLKLMHCFIANSCNFKISHDPEVMVDDY